VSTKRTLAGEVGDFFGRDGDQWCWIILCEDPGNLGIPLFLILDFNIERAKPIDYAPHQDVRFIAEVWYKL